MIQALQDKRRRPRTLLVAAPFAKNCVVRHTERHDDGADSRAKGVRQPRGRTYASQPEARGRGRGVRDRPVVLLNKWREPTGVGHPRVRSPCE